MPKNSGGRPRHNLSSYITVLKKKNPNDKDRQCLCNACVEVLKDDAKPIVNRKERIKSHLMSCEYFWNKHDNAEEILRNCDEDNETHPNKYIRIDGKYFLFIFLKKF